MNRSVLQDWVCELPFMQQSVLITACRGPDGLPKNHAAKVIGKYVRRCFLIRAFEKDECCNPYAPGGGSFTGPCTNAKIIEVGGVVTNTHRMWPHHTALSSPLCCEKTPLLDVALGLYLDAVDDMPHHFQTHIMHAAQILGACHPDKNVSDWWQHCYLRIVNDMHLNIESIEQMNKRLGDNEANWRAAEL
ncbi:hypothetical protein LCGC14_0392140 [marine sediment metagenome]|uniref:Uncharacterized protein n=1 Tax=marine sediment metagenome TaxID=412755 RepID=A0A0F9SZD4_9ZZZZ